MSYKARLKAIVIVLLALIISACSKPQIVKTDVKYIDRPVSIPLPSELLKDCKKPFVSDSLTQTQLIELVIETLVNLNECSERMMKIRELNE